MLITGTARSRLRMSRPSMRHISPRSRRGAAFRGPRPKAAGRPPSSPKGPSQMATSLTLASIIGTVPAATGYRYGVRDSVGNRMDTLKVIDNPAGGYLGVYHTGDQVKVATSTDLLTWTFRRTLDPQATQPSILALPTGGYLTAVE